MRRYWSNLLVARAAEGESSIAWVGVFTRGEPGWHGQRLAKALARRGLACSFVDPTECVLQLDLSGRVCLSGGLKSLPRAVFVRGIGSGGLEQIIFRLDLLHALERQGVSICNPPRAIEHTVDKGMSSLLLLRAALPTPSTRVCETREAAVAYCREAWRAGRRLVLKPLFGSEGRDLSLLSGPEDLARCVAPGGVWYLQHFVERATEDFWDLRVLVIGGRARAVMRRSAGHWITNRARGARCELQPLDPQCASLAEEAARALGVCYAGVDLVPDVSGALQVLEVNGVPSWRGMQELISWDIAEALVDLLEPSPERIIPGAA